MFVGSSSGTVRRRRLRLYRHTFTTLSEPSGSALYEFALTMPFLVVLAIGMVDFGQAWNLKQKVSNAAREGARFGASQSTADLVQSNVVQSNPPSVTAIANVVGSYLANAGLTQCSTAAPTNWTEAQPSGLQWTFSYSDSSCVGFSLVIDRGDALPPGGAGASTVVATHVTLTYPYTWTFNHVIGLLVSGANPSLPSTISSDAVMQNVP